MFTKLEAHPALLPADHRALPGVSNTDLSTLKAELLGQLRAPNPLALAFGAHFHTATLEPAHYRRTDERCNWALLERLAAQVRRQRYCRDLLYRGTPELTHTATHIETSLVVKVRPDLLITSPRTGRRVVVDFKTTSCRTYAQFCAAIEQYDYDRQAAFYSDVLQAARFVIIGVQKKLPHEVWQVEVTQAPGLLDQGRKKYSTLLRHYARRQPAAQPASLAAAHR